MTAAHTLIQNHKGNDITFAFVIAQGIAAVTMIWHDGDGSVFYSSIESARKQYKSMLASGAQRGSKLDATVGVAGTHNDYRPFVEIDGVRYYGDRERKAQELEAAKWAA